jgi:hypothetical protein
LGETRHFVSLFGSIFFGSSHVIPS